MKTKLFVILFIISTFGINAQGDCGTKLPPGYMQNKIQLMSTGVYIPQDTCIHRELSVIWHVVQDSNAAPGFSLGDLTTAISNLNNYFKPICLSFKSCSTNYIPNYNYNQWDGSVHEPPVFANYYVDSTINIYVVETILNPSGAAGYAYMPGGPDAIVLSKPSLTDLTPIHEMGHFLGLPHTWETSAGVELVNGSNCATAGDAFCDTEADPYPAGENNNEPCSFTYGPQDANGNYFTPPLDNIMTYYKNCRCRFTQDQYNFMAYTFVTARYYLH